jgi:hypothetical protein
MANQQSDNLSSWTIFNGKVSSTDPVSYKIVATVEMFSPLGAGPRAILLKQNSANQQTI